MARSSIARFLNTLAAEALPPALRDSASFRAVLKLLFGARVAAFDDLRQCAPTMSQTDLRRFYAGQIRRRSARVTDNTNAVIRRIEADVLPGRVCDVGCGTGYLLRKLTADGSCTGVGVDHHIAERRLAGNISFVEASIDGLPFADGAFETVVSTHTLEHALQLCSAVQELRRVAARRLIVVVPRERPGRWGLNAHLHFFVYPWQLAVVMRPQGSYRCERMGSALYYIEDMEED
ncbi:class I SAM-dependent methyltransferase [uncultured Thiohalocapsa sp.]|uniref:class I SAM-dependent methyltransferase n=1 Tax=uncultured Thiohalocapsa sp. TaxID=768990 RepID=UPI0025EDEB1B|nr:class I SAM-dependent methyltransferase [uncultured Thiohalocapsa sp.]